MGKAWRTALNTLGNEWRTSNNRRTSSLGFGRRVPHPRKMWNFISHPKGWKYRT